MATVGKSWFRRNGLFGKYVVSFVGLVVLVLAVNGGLETWFTYPEITQLLANAQSEKAEATARRIEQYVTDIERQISWATRASATTLEQRQSDYALLLQQVPAIDRVIQLDDAGKEQLRLTRGRSSRTAGSTIRAIPRFTETQTQVDLVVAGLLRRARSVHDHRDDAFRPKCGFDRRGDQSQVPVELYRAGSDRQGRRCLRRRTDRAVAGPFQSAYRLGIELADLPQVAAEFSKATSR